MIKKLDLKYILFFLFDPIDIVAFVDSEHRRWLMSWNMAGGKDIELRRISWWNEHGLY